MILGADIGSSERDAGKARATLDDLFRRAGVQSPDALALIDAPNRKSFTDGAPRRLTYAQADRAISVFAARLCRLGLQTDAIVAVQLPNTVDNVIALLGILRAGMIAVPLPVLWRRHDITAALRHLGAKALITAGRIGTVAHAEIAMQVAAELFPIRFICAFGNELPDGVLPLDDIFNDKQPVTVLRTNRIRQPGAQATDRAADHLAVVTFEVSAGGLVPVARNHTQLLAAGRAINLECGVTSNANILSAIPPSSFAGIAVTLLPWLAGGGALSLHHGFDPKTFSAQTNGPDQPGTIIIPGAAVAPLAQAGFLGGDDKTVLALWRSPEQLAVSASTSVLWRGRGAAVDVLSFGEIGLLPARRGLDDMPLDIPHGRIGAPRLTGAAMIAETARSKHGTLLLRGPMVQGQAFPPVAERSADPHLQADARGFVDTGFTCRPDSASQSLAVTGPPGGISSIGGYRFRPSDIESQVAAADPAATVIALPGGLLAQRLAGGAADHASVGARLKENGANALISGAFRARGKANAA